MSVVEGVVRVTLELGKRKSILFHCNVFYISDVNFNKVSLKEPWNIENKSQDDRWHYVSK